MLPVNSLNYLSAFLAGFLVSLTPCVYPMIPVAIGYIGARAAQSVRKAFFLSLSYCLGVALTYSALGVFAALTGQLFGQLSASPWVNLVVGAIFVFFGLSVLEVFNFPYITLITPKPLKFKSTELGGLGAFILGVTSGLVMGPCTTPVLASILVYISSRQNIFFGAGLMFSFALGMSIIFLLVGTFSFLLNRLPKSERWLLATKKILGVILILAGCYFIFLAGRRWL